METKRRVSFNFSTNNLERSEQPDSQIQRQLPRSMAKFREAKLPLPVTTGYGTYLEKSKSAPALSPASQFYDENEDQRYNFLFMQPAEYKESQFEVRDKQA